MSNRAQRRRASNKQGGKATDPRPPGRAADNGLGIGDMPGEYGQSLRSVFDPQTGLGSDMRYTRFRYPRILDEYELTALGMDGLAQRVITYPVTRAMACGYEIAFSASVPANMRDRLLNLANNEAQRLQVDTMVGLLGVRARWYGDAIEGVAFASDQGARSLSSPPAWGQAVRWLTVWDRRDWFPINYETVDSARYRQPAWLHLMIGRPLLESERWYGYRTGNYAQVPLHPRRYVRLHTVSGFSVFQAIAPYYVSLLQSSQGASNLMQRASLGHFRIRDWSEMVRSRGTEAQAIIQAQYDAMSTANVVVTDGVGDEINEDFELQSSTISGVDAGVYAAAYLFSAASGIPLARVLGTSPGAFQSGELQDNMWYELLGETQAWLTPALKWNWDAIFASVLGGARVPEYDLRWNSPRVLSDAAAVDLRAKALDVAIKGLTANLLTPDAAVAALNTDRPGDFQYGTVAAGAPEPAQAPAPAKAASEAAPTAEVVPAVAEGEGAPEQLSDVALNSAQVQSLVSVATDPLLTIEAKEAIIAAAFPTISPAYVAKIARGALIAGAAAPAAAQAPAQAPAGPPSEVADEPADEPADRDLWRTSEQIAELFGAITSGQLTRHAASAPGVREAGKLTWIKPGRSRLYKLSDVEALWSVGGDDLDEGTEDDPPAGEAAADNLAPSPVARALRTGRVVSYDTRRMRQVCDMRARDMREVPDVVFVSELTGSYAMPSPVGGWRGWIEHEGGIAFVHKSGLGLWWQSRDAEGGVLGMPVVFAYRGSVARRSS